MAIIAPEVTHAANAVSEQYNSRVLIYSGEIDSAGVGRLLESLRLETPTKKTNTFLMLTTNGGQADAAYRIARVCQIISENFYLFVPVRCKSAGTLLALWANEILMTPIAELGPLDIQIAQRNEISRMRSGLVVRAALEGLAAETLKTYEQMMLHITRKSGGTISFEVASQVAVSLTSAVMSPVYAQIKPEDLGKDLRDLQVARAYGERLVKVGKNATRRTVQKLVEEYPTHSFIIDASEAKTIFNTVTDPSKEVTDLYSVMSTHLDATRNPCYVERLDTDQEEKDNGQTSGN